MAMDDLREWFWWLGYRQRRAKEKAMRFLTKPIKLWPKRDPEKIKRRPRTLKSHDITNPFSKYFLMPDPFYGLDLGDADKRTLNQFQSPFFKLPYEIRELIYQFALGGKTIHVFNDFEHRRLQAVICSCPTTFLDDVANRETACFTLPLRCDIWHHLWSNQRLLPRHSAYDGLLSLAKSCRRLYLESMPILYATNCLTFTHYWAFVDFSRTIRIQRLNLISTVCLSHFFPIDPPQDDQYAKSAFTAWLQICLVLKAMPGLRKLRLNLAIARGYWSRLSHLETLILEHLRPIKQCSSFQLRLTFGRPIPNHQLLFEKRRKWEEMVHEFAGKPFELFFWNFDSGCYEKASSTTVFGGF
ncbi:hypothetical protein BT63DRAFT_291378 [Microthyrium microscopicum]|uniref:DUF7730 domain-containing protein n=1 Tax=Microthyrium microscopicum TaxID=703497 RepID=A0A6A6U750_9PEZI|nr:hypothetical protein BT63DRAFT_291378 [Microthyrium microscopicum]